MKPILFSFLSLLLCGCYEKPEHIHHWAPVSIVMAGLNSDHEMRRCPICGATWWNEVPRTNRNDFKVSVDPDPATPTISSPSSLISGNCCTINLPANLSARLKELERANTIRQVEIENLRIYLEDRMKIMESYLDDLSTMARSNFTKSLDYTYAIRVQTRDEVRALETRVRDLERKTAKP